MDQRLFFSMNKLLDWDRGEATNLNLSDAGFSIVQTEKYTQEKIIDGRYINEITRIHQVAISADGRLSFLDESAKLWYFDYRNQFIEPSILSGRGLFSLTSLLMPFEDVCMIGTPDRSADTLMNVSTLNGQIIWARDAFDDGTPLKPLAMDGRGDRNLYVLAPLFTEEPKGDQTVKAGTRLAVIRFDGAGKIRQTFTHPLLELREDRRMSVLMARFTINVSERGDLLVLDRETGTVLFWEQGTDGVFASCLHHAMQASDAVIRSDGQVFFADGRTSGKGAVREEERFIYEWNRDTGRLVPIMAARGRYDRLFIDGRDRIYAWNEDLQKLAIFRLTPRTRELGETGELKGIFTYGPFDSREEANRWHKLEMKGNIPEEAQVRVYLYAADRLEYLDGGELILLNQEHLMAKPPDAFPWTGPIINAKEAMMDNQLTGRYLFMRLELLGSDRASPFIERIRIYYPKETYLAYLPSIYQEDRASRQFLERYLSLFASFMESVTEQVEAVPKLYELSTTSEDFLQWIGYWLGIRHVEHWDEEALRTLLLEAPDLFKRRGTRYVIERLLTICLGEKPFILEQFETVVHRQDQDLKQVFDHLYGTDPYTFFIFIRSELIEEEEVRAFVEQLIEEEKPAYTRGVVVALDPWMYLDMHTYLGVNTYLSELSLLRLDNRSVIPADTVIIDVERSKRMSIHTRMDVDSSLE